MDFEKAVNLFMEHLNEKDRSPKTISHYDGCLSRFNKYLVEKYNRLVYVDEVTPDDFEKYLYEPPNDKNLTQVSRYTITTAFKSFYTFCYNKDYCKGNIGRQLTPIKARSKERAYITEEELMKMVGKISNETDKAIMQTMFYTGMRIGEAINLTLADINFTGNYIHVKKRKSRYDRKVPISIKLRIILEDYLEYCRSEIETDSDRVFVLANGGNYTESRFNKMIKRTAQKAELDGNMTSHIMRHSFASNLIAKGVDVARVKKLLGHESIITTNIYLHTNMQLLRKAVDKL
ncbi:MAG: tyrosine-type recombinase/integrase [Bacillota bacterium]